MELKIFLKFISSKIIKLIFSVLIDIIFIIIVLRWKKIPTEDNVNTFVGVARQNVWKIWRQNSKQIAFRRLATFETTPFSNQMSNVEILEDYFQVFVLHFKLKFKLKNIDVVQLYDYWESVDSFFKQQLNENAHNLIGIRILKQDLIETIFSFICSANNNIPRISSINLFADNLVI